MAKPGKFITFEGGEGSGKTTQLALLAHALEKAELDVVTTREPGGTPGAEEIRNLLVRGTTDRWPPMAEVLLLLAARVDHVETFIQPALEAGSWVLCDRFSDSTLAYQGGGHGLGVDRMRNLQKEVLGEFAPDLTLILDLTVEAGLARAFGRAGAQDGPAEDRFERMDLDFHRRIRAVFLELAAAEPGRCQIIDAERDMAAVQADVRAAVAERLGIDLPDLTP